MTATTLFYITAAFGVLMLIYSLYDVTRS